MKKFVFLAATFLLCLSTASAEYVPTIRQIENNYPDLDTYIVGLTDNENGISCVCDLTIEEGVHQITVFDVDTPYNNPLLSALLGDLALLDTCFLPDLMGSFGNGVSQEGGDYVESHDGSDPCNIVGSNDLISSAGIGSFYPDPNAIQIATAIRNPGYDLYSIEFMQMVVPHGETATLTGFYTSLAIAEPGFPMISFTITVPEPSTVALLVLGGLGLLGIWFKKR